MMVAAQPAWVLVRAAVAAVWLYEGLWCKLLRGQPHELEVVRAVPGLGTRFGDRVLRSIGLGETGLAIWVILGVAAVECALVQTVLLVSMNAAGLRWARRIIADPAGMIVKNFAFLTLAWVAATRAAAL
jgi:uncharacterized membrane protein YphA (DoxX/SURF4 family)